MWWRPFIGLIVSDKSPSRMREWNWMLVTCACHTDWNLWAFCAFSEWKLDFFFYTDKCWIYGDFLSLNKDRNLLQMRCCMYVLLVPMHVPALNFSALRLWPAPIMHLSLSTETMTAGIKSLVYTQRCDGIKFR